MRTRSIPSREFFDRSQLKTFLIISVLVNVIFIYKTSQIQNLSQETTPTSQEKQTSNVETEKLYEAINPKKGYAINATYADLGPQMVKLGVIDIDKFRQAYENGRGQMPQEYVDILQKGSSKQIRITRENAYFLLNYFWAVGLANKSKTLDTGELMKYGGLEGAGNFASTGGWSLGKTDAMNYYSKSSLVPLTKEQEALVEAVASDIYRPCCDNSTAFPDCNHGMALLGVLELMAAKGANEDQMYEAAKYFNAFWFPGNYYDLALYFRNKEKKNFQSVDARLILSREYSSATGWQTVKQWLSEKGIIEQPPKQGGGCGV